MPPADAASEPVPPATRWLLAAVFAATCAVNLLPRQTWIVDDALIFQIFVRNALSGAGLVYAPGNPVEGYSSPLWTLILLASGWIGASGFTASRALSAVCAMAACALIAFVPARRSNLRLLLVAGLLLPMQSALLWFASTGMDTSLMTLVLAAGAVGVMRGQLHVTAAMAGLAAITRPEGVLYSLPLCLWLAAECKRSSCPARTRWVVASLAAAPAIAWEIFRLCSYGALIANSAYAKLGASGMLDSGASGLAYLLESFFQLPGPWLLALAGAAFLRKRLAMPGDAVAATLVALIAVGTLFAFAVKGDWMPGSRLFVPLIPPMILVALHGALTPRTPKVRALTAGFALAGVLTLAQQILDYVPGQRPHLAQWPAPLSRAWNALPATRLEHFFVHYMLRYTLPGDTVAHFNVGESGYLACDVNILDQYGLVSRYESEFLHGLHTPAELAEHFRALSPSLVFFLRSDVTRQPAMRVGAALAPELARNYTQVSSAPWFGKNTLEVHVRNDALNRVADPARFARWQQQSRGLVFSARIMLAKSLGSADRY